MDGQTTLETTLVRRAVAAGGDGDAVRATIDGLAGCLNTGPGAGFQLSELGCRLGGLMRLGEEARPDVALRALCGDELVLVVALAAIGQRRGFAVDVLFGAERAFVGHYDAPTPLVIDPRNGFLLVDARELGEPLDWASPAQVAARLGLPRGTPGGVPLRVSPRGRNSRRISDPRA